MSKIVAQRIKKFIAICIAVLLGILIQPIFTPAQSTSQLEFRINLLDSQIAELRSAIARLESQGSRSYSPQPPTGSPNPVNPTRRSSDPMFDNLATLAIEIKQDVRKLEERVSRLEATMPTRNR